MFKRSVFKYTQKRRNNYFKKRFRFSKRFYAQETSNPQYSSLPNQVRVSSFNRSTNGDLVSLGVFVDTGSVSETDQTNGVSNFIRYLSHSGTQKRSESDLQREFESIGSTVETFVTREQIGYVAHTSKNNVSKTLELLSDIVLNSKNDVESVKKTIIHEKEYMESNISETIFDHLHQAAFQKSPLSRSPFGELESLPNITKEQVDSFVANQFTGPRIAVTANGPVTHDEVVQLSGKYFEKAQPGQKVNSKSGKTDFIGSEFRIRDDTMHDAHVVIGYKGVSNTSNEYYQFLLIQILSGAYDRNMGGGKNLPSRIAEKVALGEYIKSYETFNFNYRDIGLFGVYCVVNPELLDDGLYTLQNEWMKTAKYLSNKELQRAKNKLKTNILIQWNNSSTVLEELARQTFNIGTVQSPTEILNKIDSISVSDIRCTMDKYFNDVEISLIGIGAIEELPDYVYTRSRTFWYRF